MNNRHKLKQARRWVVKIGSALLTANGQGLDQQAMRSWVAQMVALTEQGIELVLVSSGAVAEGMVRMGISHRPDSLHDLQACAAIGQMGLVQAYESHFREFNCKTAQILLTNEDLSDRQRYLNARSTLTALINWKVIPVINENDTVATDEIRFGDNLPKTRSGKIMRRILRKIAAEEFDTLGDTSTLADPAVVEDLIKGRKIG